MILPENGSVIVIDDDPNQAMPIINALSKKGIAVTYFKGRGEKEIPDKPIGNVRLAIVDLQLLPTDNDDHVISTRLINVLKNVIPPDNGPYMLLIWSLKKRLFGDHFRNEVNKKENGVVPICIASLEKSECIREITVSFKNEIEEVISELESGFDKEDLKTIKEAIERHINKDPQYETTPNAIEIIENSLNLELKKAGVFHLFIMWENLIRKAGYQLVNSVSSTIEYTNLWEKNMRDVLKRMSRARAGQYILTDNLSLKAALSIFSESFSDELEAEIRNLTFPKYINPKCPFSIASKLNKDTYKIVVYPNEGESFKVKLLKNDKVYKKKEGISYASIISLSDGLDNSEAPFIKNLVRTYQEIPAFINTRLHLELKPSKVHMPGNVYKIEVLPARKTELLKTYFDKNNVDVSDFHFIEMEVSPICDYAQKKWIKSRLISGLVYPVTEKIKKDQFLYSKGPKIIIKNKMYSIAFCYLLFKAQDIEEVEGRGKPWFRIKRELLLDIVANLSSHVNRPGITTVT